jgi:hypothetical protein
METTMSNSEVTTAPNPRISPENYNRVLRSLNLVSLSLWQSEARFDPQIAAEVFGQGESAPVDTSESAKFELQDGLVVIGHSYSLVSRRKRKALLSIKADYVLAFQTSEEFTEEFFELFREVALPMYTWPYFREFVASMTERMDLPKLQLGLRHAPAF